MAESSRAAKMDVEVAEQSRAVVETSRMTRGTGTAKWASITGKLVICRGLS